jgi:hypothetical protein
MERDLSQTLYTVILTGVRDQASQMKVAQTLSSVSGRLPMEAVMKRLDALPWTLTRKASYKRAYRLAKLLESLGGHIRCIPPLPKSSKPAMDETLILPGAELLSQTQVMSATQFISRPEEPSPTPSAVPVPVEKTHRSQPDVLAEREPTSEDSTPGQPEAHDTGSNGDVGFFRKHLWEFLVGILVLAFMGSGLMLTIYVLARYWR